MNRKQKIVILFLTFLAMSFVGMILNIYFEFENKKLIDVENFIHNY